MSITAIVGVNWGDEGKGRIVDYLAGDYEIVVRYQGGNNAGHTVINEYGKFALNLLPSGIFHPGTLNILGTGTVIDLEHLVKEIEGVRAKGVRIDAGNLKISDRAIICFPYHQAQDRLEEERLGSKKYGSTVRGIAPVYGDKYLKKGIQIGELFYPAYLKERLATVLEWKNAELTKVYGGRAYQLEEILAWLAEYGEKLKPMVTDTTTLLKQAVKAGKKILLEAQLGALRDIHYGIYPFTTSSSSLAAFAPVGAGVFNRPVERIIGVVKAYSTCVGEGPFVTELFDEVGDQLRQTGAEYGAATGRPRRIGYLDLVATKYGAELQGATELALTKLDVLSREKRLKVCVGYEIDGEVVTTFPLTPLLYKAKPVYVELDGWEEDISVVRSYSQLPAEARRYVQYIEEWLEIPVKYISVGAKREEIIVR
ncbi:MAG: adenylosuccinate synthase [Firmicutes bacterium]|nr:adenylosuccinate synthase [Bacillota bacterium]